MPAGNTYEAIFTNTLGSATSSVTFSSIPSTYTDLVLVVNCGFTSTGDLSMQLNGNTGSAYSTTLINGNGSSAISWRSNSTDPRIYFNYNGLSAGSFSGNYIINIMNYTNTTTFKTVIGRYNGASNETGASIGLFRATPAAINSVTIMANGANTFVSGSTFNLYGIKAA